MIDFILGETKDQELIEKRKIFTEKYSDKDLEEFHKLITENENEL